MSGRGRLGVAHRPFDRLRVSGCGAAGLMVAVNDGLVLQWQTLSDKVEPEE